MNNAFEQNNKTLKQKWLTEITEIPKPLQQSYLPGLDGMRAIAIIMVIAGHMMMPTSLTNYFNGACGVKIFFVISGFLITTLLLKEKIRYGKVSFKHFYIRRALRIVPVAYLFLLVLIILNYPLNLAVSARSFLTSFLYIKNIPFKNAGEWWTGHFWSLSVEEQFYLVFPFFIVFTMNRFILMSILIIVIAPLLVFVGFNNIGIFYTNAIVHTITYIFISLIGKGTASILIGSLYAVLLFKKIITIENLKSNYFLSFILLILSYATYIMTINKIMTYSFEFVFPFVIGYVILLNLKEKNFLRYILDSKLLVNIGVISYSLYIWQQLLTSPDSRQHPNCWEFILRIAIIFIIAIISYYGFEKQFLKLKARFK